MIGILGAGAFVFGMDALFNGASNGSSLSVTDDITTRMSNMVINKNISRNKTDKSSIQDITITGEDGMINEDAATMCGSILNEFEVDFIAQFGGDLDMAKKILESVNFSGYTSTDKTANTVIHSLDTGLDADAYTTESSEDQAIGTHLWCDPVNFSIVIKSMRQNSVIRENSQISDEINIVNDLQNSIDGQISSKLSNDVDLPGGWMDSLSGNTQSISSQYSTSISNIVQQVNDSNTDQVTNMKQDIQIQGHSLIATNIVQNSQMESNFISQSIVDYNNSLKNSVEYMILQALENKNNTTKELADAFDAALADSAGLITEGVTQIMILATIIISTGISFSVVRNMHTDWQKERMAVINNIKTSKPNILKRVGSKVIVIVLLVILAIVLIISITV
jgi:hypothetical protein